MATSSDLRDALKEIESLKKELESAQKHSAAWKNLSKSLWASSKEGGAHLGEMRRWIQWNVRNGDRLTWGSTQLVDIRTPMYELSSLACRIGAGAMREAKEAKERGERHYKMYLKEACFREFRVKEAVKAENEACAALVSDMAEEFEKNGDVGEAALDKAADAIRDRLKADGGSA